MSLTSVSHDSDLAIVWSFNLPAHAVWVGISDQEMLSQWLGRALEFDLRAGGAVVVDHGGGTLSRSVVTELVQQHRLVMTWAFPAEPESRLSLRLYPTESGSTLELVHSGLRRLAEGYGPGWITHLTYLEAAVSGAPLSWSQFWPMYASFEVLYTRPDPGGQHA